MIEEQKGELVNMNNWENIIKARVRPIRELDPERRNRSPERRKPPVKVAGGKPSLLLEEWMNPLLILCLEKNWMNWLK